MSRKSRSDSGLLAVDAASAFAEQPPGIVGLVGVAGDLRVDLGEPMAIERERVAIERLDGVLDGGVPRVGEADGVVECMRADRVAQRARVEEPDRRAAPERRVRARPRVAERGHTGDDGLAVDDERAVPVFDLRHDRDVVVERLAVGPVRHEWVAVDDSLPHVDVARRRAGLRRARSR